MQQRKNNPSRYVLVTPCKNEAKHLGRVIESVVRQEFKPLLWVIVNDGSTDNSLSIIKKYSSKFKWIKFISLEGGARDLNSRYAEVCRSGFSFLENYSRKKPLKYSFVGLMDADIVLDKNYFKGIVSRMQEDRSIGVASGGVFYYNKGVLEYEYRHESHPRGAARLWRKNVFWETGGFADSPAPDTVSNIKIRMKGWKLKQFRDLKAVQVRKTSSAQGLWKGYASMGAANHYLHVNFFLALLKSAKHFFRFPFYTGAAFFYGYALAFVKGREKIEDKDVKLYNRKRITRNG